MKMPRELTVAEVGGWCVATILQEQIELTVGFALGGLLLLADGAMERATRRMSGAARQRAGLTEPRR